MDVHRPPKKRVFSFLEPVTEGTSVSNGKARLELAKKLNERSRHVQKRRKQRERLRKMAKDLETTEAQIQVVDEDIKRLQSVLEERTDEVSQEIRARADEFRQAFMEANLDKLYTLFTDDYAIVGQGDARHVGKGGIQEHMSYAQKLGITRVEFVEDRYEAGALANDVGFHSGVFLCFNKDDKQICKCKDLVLWKKVGGAWKVHREMVTYYDMAEA